MITQTTTNVPKKGGLMVRVMLFNATFNNMSAISRWLVLLKKPPTCRKSLTNLITYRLHLAMSGIRTSYISNYHTITTTTASQQEWLWYFSRNGHVTSVEMDMLLQQQWLFYFRNVWTTQFRLYRCCTTCITYKSRMTILQFIDEYKVICAIVAT